MAEQVEVEIVFDPVFGSRTLSKIQDESGKAGRKAGNRFNRGFQRATRGISSALGGIRGQLLGLGAAAAGAFAFRGIVNAVSEIQKLETGLTTLLGSADLAKETLEELQSFAANTPFQLPGIANSANQLLAFGFGQDEVIDKLGVLGDVAAGSNSRLEEVALIFGQISAAGKLTGERLLQLQERAIPIGSALASSLGVAEAEVRDLVSSGKVGFAEFEQAFNSLTTTGGLFEGALKRQSQTVGGVLSTLSDNFFNLQVELGKTFGPAIIDSANAFIGIFKNFSEQVAANGPVLTRTFKTLADIFLIQPAKFWSDLFAGDGAQNLAEVNKEIEVTNKKLAQAERRLEITRGSRLAEIFGGRKQALKDFGDLAARLGELKKLQSELTASTNRDTTAVKENLKAQQEAKKAAQERARIERERQAAADALGNVGLTREQQVQAQFERDQQLLETALERKALTQQEFNERELELERLKQEQLTQIRQQEEERRRQELQRLQEQQFENEASLADSLSNLGTAFKATARSFRVTSKDIARSLTRGIGVAAGNAFSAFGRALVTGENALAAFGKALLSAFGGTLVQLGTGFILQGIAYSFAGLANGPALIGAGGALALFGGVLQALGGGGGGGAAASAGGGATAGGGGLGGGGFDDPTLAQQEQETELSRITVNIQGDVLDGEETGTRLVQIINDSFEQDGVVITNGSFA